MGRPKETDFSEYVERKNNNKGFKCLLCEKEFKGSISRFKSHLSGIPGLDIRPCEKVTDVIKQKACEAIPEERLTKSRKRKERPSSSTHVEGDHPPNWSQPIDEAQELIAEAEEANGRETDYRVSEQNNKTRGYVLPTTELVGEMSEINLKQILYWLTNSNSNSSIIGIHGMVGVGKTELAKHVNNTLLTAYNMFDDAHWVTVSQKFDILKLQDAIAKTVNVSLSSAEDENIRAAQLSEAFKKRRFVVIFDDVWDYIPLEMVGINAATGNCKVIVTTTSLDVCHKMGCQNIIEVKPLYDEYESWELLMKEIGIRSEEELSPEAKATARSIVLECDGLPLGIKTIAKHMRGMVTDVHEWRNALHNLKGSVQSQENMEIFQKLICSYENLNDSTLKQSFLCVALLLGNVFGDYNSIKRELIQHLIDEGIIKRKKSWREEFDEGHCVINRLKNLCLVYENDSDWEPVLHMNMLVWHMAVQVMKQTSHVLVEVGKGLEELPEEGSWTEDLVKVSLIDTDIKHIFPGYSPRCPNLRTLLLNHNYELIDISGSFFKQMTSLQVLDLSYCNFIEELPDSIFELESLVALRLISCTRLRKVPSVAKLRGLKTLELSHTGIEQLPEGMEKLSNLRYLGIINTNIKELCPGILPKLCNLQALLLGDESPTVRGEEIACLRKLEILQCRFLDGDEFNKFVATFEGSRQLHSYKLLLGQIFDYDLGSHPGYYPCMGEINERIVAIQNCSINCGENAISLPENIKGMFISDCRIARRFMFEKATQLEIFSAEDCDGIECMLSFFPPEKYSYVSSNSITFSHLKEIEISWCDSLKKLFPSWLLPNLRNLEKIEVRACMRMEELIVVEKENENIFYLPKLVRVELIKLPELKSICGGTLKCNSLQCLTIMHCDKVKKIPISLLSEDNTSPLPSLKSIVLRPGLQQWNPPNTPSILSNSGKIRFTNFGF